MTSVHEVPQSALPGAALVDAAPAARSLRPHLRVVPDAPGLAFDDAVRRLTPRLQRYATRRLGDRHEAEELVQEALLRAYDHRTELATEDDLAAWTHCVTGRLVIDRLRVRGRSVSVAEVPEGTRVGRDTADVVVARDEARLALDALDAMPARQAAVLWAREVEGLGYDEIGDRFGMTEPAVRSTLSRARKALRREFATRGGTLPAAGLVALAPWVDGLTWVERLRRAAVRAAAPAALGAAGLTVLGGVLVAPYASPVETAPPSRPAVSTQQRTPAEAVPAPKAVAPTAVAPTTVAPPAAAPSAPATGPDGLVDRSGLGTTCVDAHGYAAGGTACEPPLAPNLEVGPALPANPTGIAHLGVENSILDCERLPSLPLTRCTAPGGRR